MADSRSLSSSLVDDLSRDGIVELSLDEEKSYPPPGQPLSGLDGMGEPHQDKILSAASDQRAVMLSNGSDATGQPAFTGSGSDAADQPAFTGSGSDGMNSSGQTAFPVSGPDGMDSFTMSLAAMEKRFEYFSSSAYFTQMATAVSKIVTESLNISGISSRPLTPTEVNTFGSAAQDEEASLSSSSSLDSAPPSESQASFPESHYPRDHDQRHVTHRNKRDYGDKPPRDQDRFGPSRQLPLKGIDVSKSLNSGPRLKITETNLKTTQDLTNLQRRLSLKLNSIRSGFSHILKEDFWPAAQGGHVYSDEVKTAVYAYLYDATTEYTKTNSITETDNITPKYLMSIFAKQVSGHSNEARRRYLTVNNWIGNGSFTIQNVLKAPAEILSQRSRVSKPLLDEFKDFSLVDFVNTVNAVLMLMQLQQIKVWQRPMDLALEKVENYNSMSRLLDFSESRAPLDAGDKQEKSLSFYTQDKHKGGRAGRDGRDKHQPKSKFNSGRAVALLLQHFKVCIQARKGEKCTRTDCQYNHEEDIQKILNSRSDSGNVKQYKQNNNDQRNRKNNDQSSGDRGSRRKFDNKKSRREGQQPRQQPRSHLTNAVQQDVSDSQNYASLDTVEEHDDEGFEYDPDDYISEPAPPPPPPPQIPPPPRPSSWAQLCSQLMFGSHVQGDVTGDGPSLQDFVCNDEFFPEPLPFLDSPPTCLPVPRPSSVFQEFSMRMFGSHVRGDITGDGPWTDTETVFDRDYSTFKNPDDAHEAFIVDSASNVTFVKDFHILKQGSVIYFAVPRAIQSSGGPTKALAHATVLFRHARTGLIEEIPVWYAPDFPVNLLACRKYCSDNDLFILDNGGSSKQDIALFCKGDFEESKDGCVCAQGSVVASATSALHSDGLLRLEGCFVTEEHHSYFTNSFDHGSLSLPTCSSSRQESRSLPEWHAVFCCAPGDVLRQTANNVFGMRIQDGHKSTHTHCFVCKCAGMTKTRKHPKHVPTPEQNKDGFTEKNVHLHNSAHPSTVSGLQRNSKFVLASNYNKQHLSQLAVSELHASQVSTTPTVVLNRHGTLLARRPISIAATAGNSFSAAQALTFMSMKQPLSSKKTSKPQSLAKKKPSKSQNKTKPNSRVVSKHKDPRGRPVLLKSEIHSRLRKFLKRSNEVIRTDKMDHMGQDMPPIPFTPGSKLFGDFIGPVNPVGLNGEKFAITLIDVLARWCITKTFRHKDEITPWFALWWQDQKAHGIHVRHLVFDADCVLIKGRFAKLCKNLGIHIMAINTESQWQDLAEPTQRWLKRAARAALLRAGLPRKYWPMAYVLAVYVHNRRFIRRIGCTPYELWLRRGPPDVSHMRIFGQWALVLKRDAAKQVDGPFAAVCVLARFVAYAINHHGYLFQHDDNSQPFESQHVIWLLTSPEGLYLLGDAQAMTIDDIKHRMATSKAFFGFDNEQKLFLSDSIRHASSDLSLRTPPISLVRPPRRPNAKPISPDAKLAKLLKQKSDAKLRAINSDLITTAVRASNVHKNMPQSAANVLLPSSTEIEDLKKRANNSLVNPADAVKALQELQHYIDKVNRLHVPLNLSPKMSMKNIFDPVHSFSDDQIADNIHDDLRNSIGRQPAPSVQTHGPEPPARRKIVYNMAPRWKLYPDTDWRNDPFATPDSSSFLTRTNIGAGLLLPDGFDPFSKTEDPQQVIADTVDKDTFYKAKLDELNSIDENGTFILVPVPRDGSKVLKSRWVLTTKYKNGIFERHKARWVVCGYIQQLGVDYDESYAPVASTKSWRFFFAICAKRKWKKRLIDVCTAFLNADIDRDVYVEQAKGFEKTGKNGQKLVCLLKKALYGLRQAPLLWYQTLRDFLIGICGLQECVYDQCVFLKYEDGTIVLMLIIHADDLAFGFEDGNLTAQRVLTLVREEFKVTEEDLTFVLGMSVNTLSDGSIFVEQEAYIDKVLKRFEMQDCTGSKTPMDDKLKFSTSMKPPKDCKLNAALYPYLEVIGCLSYLVCGTRPDLAFAYHMLSRFSQKPQQAHCQAAKRVLRYLKETKHYGLRFDPDSDMILRGYADADFGNDPDTSRSHTGYITTLGDSPMFWNTTLQRLVALSTTESEVCAAVACVKEVSWERGFLAELGFPQDDRTEVFEDNQGCQKIAEGPKTNQRQKHYIIKCRYLNQQQCPKTGIFRMIGIPTAHNIADLFTKALGRVKFFYHSSKLLWNKIQGRPAFLKPE